MNEIKEKIRLHAAHHFPEIIETRRYLHQHPELSFQEEKTAAYIGRKLDNLGIEWKGGYAGNGIRGIIRGEKKTSERLMTIALRADIDALPLTEKNEVSYRSINEGIMHACGHDAHTASLLGTAAILNELKETFSGNILLLFQPAEEMSPGGAKQMIEDGVFDDLPPDVVLGQHVFPHLPAGKLGFRPGMYMASSDEVFLKITGKGGHAATPDLVNDTVLATAQILIALQQITARLAPPAIPTVLSFGKITANGSTNIIPDEVRVEGTFRTMNEEWRAKAKKEIVRIAEAAATAAGVKCAVTFRDGYPYLINDPEITRLAADYAAELIGASNVEALDVRMTAEDFAYFTQRYPACFYRFGTANYEKGITAPLHSSRFDIDEEALRTSASAMAWIAWSFLISSIP